MDDLSVRQIYCEKRRIRSGFRLAS